MGRLVVYAATFARALGQQLEAGDANILAAMVFLGYEKDAKLRDFTCG
jgi:hypothetical protein